MKNFKVIALFCVTYFCYYLTRYNYPVALPFLKSEFALTATQVGLIATVLTLGYAVGQLINGVLVDRRGPRLMMTIGGLGAMVANLLMGGSATFDMLVIAWLANGYFQAMGYPSTLKLVVNWFKAEDRGKAVGASEFSQSVASIAILPLAGFLAAQFSWRMVFSVPALIMGVVTIWYYVNAKDSPIDEELVILANKPLLKDMLSRYKVALADWHLVAANFSYGFSQFVRYAMITWIPLYLFNVTKLPIFQAAIGGIAFQVGGALGSLLLGWMSDLKVFSSRRWILIAGGMVISAVAAVGIGVVPSGYPWAIMAALFVCGVGIEALEVAYFLTPTDYLGEEMTATGVGCMNATGKLVASLQGVTLGAIIDAFGYGAAFGTAGAFAILAALFVIPLGMRRATNVSVSLSDV